MRIAILRNGQSTRNRATPPPCVPPGIILIEVRSSGELPEILTDLYLEGIDLLVIDGGDGTVRETLSHLPDAFDNQPPVLGIFANGNTNLIARKLGAIPDIDALIKLRHQPRTQIPVQYFPIMKIDFAEPTRHPVRGFIAGWGAYTEGKRIADDQIKARGKRQVVQSLALTLIKTLFGSTRRGLRAGVAASISHSGNINATGSCLIGLASVLEGPLIAGINPFWGPGEGKIRWLDIAAPGRFLALAAPFVLRGRPMRWMTRAGYHSGRTRHLSLQLDTPIILDGDTIPTGPGPIQITADETLPFIHIGHSFIPG